MKLFPRQSADAPAETVAKTQPPRPAPRVVEALDEREAVRVPRDLRFHHFVAHQRESYLREFH